jgi:hypothetical protein
VDEFHGSKAIVTQTAQGRAAARPIDAWLEVNAAAFA